MIYWEGGLGKAISLDDSKKEQLRKGSQDKGERNESQVFDFSVVIYEITYLTK
jgi:hypothetical protein